MQSFLFIGSKQDGRNIALQPDTQSIELGAGITEGKETYVRDTLSVGDASIAIFRHESLTAKQVLDLVVKYYKASSSTVPSRHNECAHRPHGGLSKIEALIKRLKQSNIEPREFCARGVFGVHEV